MAQEAHNGVAVKEVVFTAMKPWLYVEAPKANDAVEFYKAAFGAVEVNRNMHPKRKAEQELPLILSTELKLGSSSFLVSDLIIEDSLSPVKTVGSGGVVFCLETEEVEAAVKKAEGAGAVKEDVSEGDCGYGGGVVKLKDPYGNVWRICTPAKVSADVEA